MLYLSKRYIVYIDQSKRNIKSKINEKKLKVYKMSHIETWTTEIKLFDKDKQ